MKFNCKIKLTLFFILFTGILFSQSNVPQGIYYQAVARDDMGNEMANEAIDLRLSIEEDDTQIYSETHTVVSDEFGLFELVIGNGLNQGSLAFSEITWTESVYMLLVELDSGNGFEIISESQLLSVPFSLYSARAYEVENDLVDDADSDPSNELISSFQILNDSLRLTENGIEYPVALSDISEDNDWVQQGDSIMYNSLNSSRVGVQNSNPTSSLHVGGTMALGITAPGAGYQAVIQATINQSVILCNVEGGPVDVILPDAQSCTGRVYYIKKFAENDSDSAVPNVTLIPLAGQTIDRQSNRVLGGNDFEEMTIVSDGFNWIIIARSSAG